jgi:hypothetical protein
MVHNYGALNEKKNTRAQANRSFRFHRSVLVMGFGHFGVQQGE